LLLFPLFLLLYTLEQGVGTIIQLIIKEMELHTNIIFKFVEFVLNNPTSLFIIGVGLTVVPAMGIMYVHRNK